MSERRNIYGSNSSSFFKTFFAFGNELWCLTMERFLQEFSTFKTVGSHPKSHTLHSSFPSA